MPWEVASIIRGRHRQTRAARELNAELAAWIWTGDIHLDPKPLTISASHYPTADAFIQALKSHQSKLRN